MGPVHVTAACPHNIDAINRATSLLMMMSTLKHYLSDNVNCGCDFETTDINSVDIYNLYNT